MIQMGRNPTRIVSQYGSSSTDNEYGSITTLFLVLFFVVLYVVYTFFIIGVVLPNMMTDNYTFYRAGR